MPDGPTKLAILDANGNPQFVANNSITTSAGSGLLQQVISDTAAEESLVSILAELQTILTQLQGVASVSDATTHAGLTSLIAAIEATLTVDLPSGAATSALQSSQETTLSSILTELQTIETTLSSGGSGTPTGPAGTPNAAVISVQGITGGTVLPVSVSGVATQTTLASVLAELVSILSALGSVAVTGTVTANAGTNLNTSALATQTTLASVLTQLNAIEATLSGTLTVTGGSGTPTGPAGTPNAAVISVQGISGGTAQPISGSVTANAGTNLNTSALTLESGNAATTATNTTAISTATGTTADAAYSSGSGSLVAILKGIFGRLAGIVLAAGSAIIGKVGIDQTTPGTTNAVYVTDFPSSQAVTGTFWQTTQPVSMAAVPTGGATAANQAPPGTAGSPNAAVTSVQGVSGGTPVPVNTQDVTASGTITAQNLNPNSGTATSNSTVSMLGLNGSSVLVIQIEGAYTGILTVQGRIDATNWFNLESILTISTNTVSNSISSASVGLFIVGVPGLQDVRISANSGSPAVSGTATITLRTSSSPANQAFFAYLVSSLSNTLALESGGNLASIATNTGNIPPQGQALLSNSLPVVLPATQITALTPPSPITNYAQETGGVLASLLSYLNNSNSGSVLHVTVDGGADGDFAGINLLETLMTDGTGLNLNVLIQNAISGLAVPTYIQPQVIQNGPGYLVPVGTVLILNAVGATMVYDWSAYLAVQLFFRITTLASATAGVASTIKIFAVDASGNVNSVPDFQWQISMGTASTNYQDDIVLPGGKWAFSVTNGDTSYSINYQVTNTIWIH